MKTVKTKVLIQRGETGLRLPGTPFDCPADKVELWIENGWVELAENQNKQAKEEKEKPETKELKQDIETKQRKKPGRKKSD